MTVKPKMPDVMCYLCGGYVKEDQWCEPYKKLLTHVRDPYELKPCREHYPWTPKKNPETNEEKVSECQ